MIPTSAMGSRGALGILLCLTVVVAGCASDHRSPPSAGPDAPNLVLVTICPLPFAHMGVGGYPRPTTPFLDSLAASGVLFENAVSASTWTKPSTASLLTGLAPNVHGLWDTHKLEDIVRGRTEPKGVLPHGLVTLAECLADAGYAQPNRGHE